MEEASVKIVSKKEKYQICAKCIMDTTDSEIKFDKEGICNHCKKYDELKQKYVFSGEEGERKLKQIVKKIKKMGENRKYDCIIGVSGGLDSTYAAYIVKELELRPLAVHVDNGWNSELATRNIEKILSNLGIDLYTEVVNWEEFKSLQIAFLKASTPDLEIPTDHALLSVLYSVAIKEKIRYIIRGSNIETEGVLPVNWSHGHRDWKYIININKRFGTTKIKNYPHFSLLKLIYYKINIKEFNILNFIDYNKKEAEALIKKRFGWENYGEKHHESIYTRFIQSYILPKKFNIDKRRVYLSALIRSSQITRNEALKEIKKEIYSPQQLREDKEYVIKQLGLNEKEFERIMLLPLKSFWDYPSYEKSYNNKFLRKVYNFLRDKSIGD